MGAISDGETCYVGDAGTVYSGLRWNQRLNLLKMVVGNSMGLPYGDYTTTARWRRRRVQENCCPTCSMVVGGSKGREAQRERKEWGFELRERNRGGRSWRE